MWWLWAEELLYERAFTCSTIVPTGQRQPEEALEADEKPNDFAEVHLLQLVSQRPQQSQAMKRSSQKHAVCWEGRFSMQHLTLCISSSLSGRQSFWGWYMTCLKVKFTVCCWTHRETGKKLDPPQIFTLFQRWCNIWLIRTLLIADLILVRQSMWGWMHSEWLIKSLILTQISKVLWITVVSTAKAIYLTYAILWKLITRNTHAYDASDG